MDAARLFKTKKTRYTSGMVTYLAKLGELTLKGSNIKQFEKQLLQNSRSYFEKTDEVKITLRAGRMYFTAEDSCSAKIEYCLEHLIGITGWAKTLVVEKEIEAIKDAVYNLCEQAAKDGAKTFKCDSRRADDGNGAVDCVGAAIATLLRQRAAVERQERKGKGRGVDVHLSVAGTEAEVQLAAGERKA